MLESDLLAVEMIPRRMDERILMAEGWTRSASMPQDNKMTLNKVTEAVFKYVVGCSSRELLRSLLFESFCGHSLSESLSGGAGGSVNFRSNFPSLPMR
jgi:hypothetical protein